MATHFLSRLSSRLARPFDDNYSLNQNSILSVKQTHTFIMNADYCFSLLRVEMSFVTVATAALAIFNRRLIVFGFKITSYASQLVSSLLMGRIIFDTSNSCTQ